MWQATREWRHRLAILLAIPGALAWGGEAVVELGTSIEPKFQDLRYLGSMTAAEVLTVAWMSFALVAILLALVAILLAFQLRLGRILLIVACVLVLLGQAVSITLALIPIDAFYYEPPPSIAFSLPLTVFPLVTIVLLLGRQEEC
ncbi:hypothetical protein NS14008_17785 [Nocardia seriolae]|nr:hypothetical protein NS14008_17785 [Nocardia seriolae]